MWKLLFHLTLFFTFFLLCFLLLQFFRPIPDFPVTDYNLLQYFINSCNAAVTFKDIKDTDFRQSMILLVKSATVSIIADMAREIFSIWRRELTFFFFLLDPIDWGVHRESNSTF